MAVENVGIDKLPNIYFRKIKLIDNDTKSFKVSLNLLVVDELIGGSFIWSEDPLIRDFVKFAIVETENLELIDELSSGDLSPHPSKIIKSPNFDQYSKIHIHGYGDLNKQEDIDDKHFTLTSHIIKRNEVQNLVLFAFAFLDHKELSNFLHIKLTGPLASYMGPLTSEKVMVAGEIQKTCIGFKRPDGELWSGPVNAIDGEWYSGSYNTAQSIKLTRHVLKNSKLIDIRTKYFQDRKKMVDTNRAIFSELSHSFGKNSDLFGLFSIDMSQLVLTKTQFGRKIYGMSQRLFSKVIDKIEINSLEIRRRQVELRQQNNKLGTRMYAPKDVLPYKVIGTLKDLKEIKLFDDVNVKTFTFEDLEMTPRTRGEYMYEIHVTFIDSTQNFVETTIEQMKNDINKLKDQVRRMNLEANYDYSRDALVDSFRDTGAYKTLIDNYCDYLSILKDISDTDLMQMKEDKKSLFKKNNYSSLYGIKMVSEYEKLHSIFISKLGIRPQELRQNKSRPNSGYPPNLIFLKKTFEDTIRFSNMLGSYDLFGLDGGQKLLELSKESFKNRADKEIDRFFDRSKAVSSEDTFNSDEDVSSAIKDLKTPSFTFMSPLGFTFDGRTSDLTSLQNVNTESLSYNFIAMKEEKEQKVNSSKTKIRQKNAKAKAKKTSTEKTMISKKSKNKFNFNFTPVAVKINQVDKKVDIATSVSKYLGENSEFVNIDNNLDFSIEHPDVKQISNKIKVANEISANRSKNHFDMTKKNNFIEKFKSSKNYSQAKLRKAPLAIKSIMNSRSTAARNNILESESDILKDTETKVASEMIFHSNQRLQALIGYEKAYDGSSILTKPLWGDITDELLESRASILCRAIYEEIPELGIVTAEEFRLPVENNMFIISGPASSGEPNIADEIEQLPEVEKTIYTTSNVIRQRGV